MRRAHRNNDRIDAAKLLRRLVPKRRRTAFGSDIADDADYGPAGMTRGDALELFAIAAACDHLAAGGEGLLDNALPHIARCSDDQQRAFAHR
jgi:hypothetical protein